MRILDLIETIQFLKMGAMNFFSSQTLGRTLEPSRITNDQDHVHDYNLALATKMVFLYGVIYSVIHRAQKDFEQKRVLDICCGPGIASKGLLQHLNYKELVAVDLSAPMLEVAQKNIAEIGMASQAKFKQHNILDLENLDEGTFDLITWMNGAHHLDTQEDVTKVIKQMEKISHDDGVLLIFDPVRPKTKYLADQYLKVSGQEYLDMGIPHFYQDFKDSINASFTLSEFTTIVPRETTKNWYHGYPFFIAPNYHFLLGVPKTQPWPYINSDFPKERMEQVINKPEFINQWNKYKLFCDFQTPIKIN